MSQELDKKAVAAGVIAAAVGSTAVEASQQDVLNELSAPESITATFEPEQSAEGNPFLTLVDQDPQKSAQVTASTDLSKALLDPELLEKLTKEMQPVADIQEKYGEVAALRKELEALLPEEEDVLLTREERQKIAEIDQKFEKLFKEIGALDQRLKDRIEEAFKSSLDLDETQKLLVTANYSRSKADPTKTETSVYVEDSAKLNADTAASYIFETKGDEVLIVSQIAQNIDLSKLLENPLLAKLVTNGLDKMREQRGFRQLMRWEEWNEYDSSPLLVHTTGTDPIDSSPVENAVLSATGIKEGLSTPIQIHVEVDEVQIRLGLSNTDEKRQYGSRSISIPFTMEERTDIPDPTKVGTPVLEKNK